MRNSNVPPAPRRRWAKAAGLALMVSLGVTACAPPFLSSDEATAQAPQDPTDLVVALEELSVARTSADGGEQPEPLSNELETQARELMQAEDLQAVTLDDVGEDFLTELRDVRLAHPVLGIFNDTDMLRVAQGTCGTLAHQGTYDPVHRLIDDQVDLGNLSQLAADGIGEWVFTSSSVFCPVTVDGLAS